MHTSIVERSTAAVVDVDTVADHCRVDDGYDSGLIHAYVLAAVELAEVYTNRYLTECTVEADIFDLALAGSEIFLPHGNPRSVTKVIGIELDGTEVPLGYTFNTIKGSLKISHEVSENYYIGARVEYKCGYAEGEVPIGIKQGIMMLVGTLYNVREDVSYGIQAFNVPMTSKLLFDKYKIYAMGE